MPLTHKQQAVFEFIRGYLAAHRMSPLIREIQAGCRITSYKSAIDRLNALERKRLIARTPNKHRGIRLVRQPQARAAKPQASELAPAAIS